MVVPFLNLPYTFQKQIFHQLDNASFKTIQEASSYVFWFSQTFCKKKTLEQTRQLIRVWKEKLGIRGKNFGRMDHQSSTFRVISNEWLFMCHLTDAPCLEIIAYLTRTNSRVNEFLLDPYLTTVQCSPENFNQLLKVARVKHFQFRRLLGVEYFRTESVRKLETCRGYCSGMGDEDFIRLEASKLEIIYSKITSRGINTLIKQWKDGKRNIKYYLLYTSSFLASEEILRGITPSRHINVNNSDAIRLTNMSNEVLIVHIFAFCVILRQWAEEL